MQHSEIDAFPPHFKDAYSQALYPSRLNIVQYGVLIIDERLWNMIWETFICRNCYFLILCQTHFYFNTPSKLFLWIKVIRTGPAQNVSNLIGLICMKLIRTQLFRVWNECFSIKSFRSLLVVFSFFVTSIHTGQINSIPQVRNHRQTVTPNSSEMKNEVLQIEVVRDFKIIVRNVFGPTYRNKGYR